MRPLLSKGDIIQVNNTKYCVEECIGSGNQAAVYRCAEPGNDRKICCVKEFIPSWAERRSRSTQSDYKPIIIPRDRRDEWLRLKESVKHSEALVRGFADESIQAHYLTEESDFERMTFKMPKVASSCQKLSDLWELWKTHPPKEMGDDSELPRIKESTEIVLSLAKAIKDLHLHQLIHGDLTPTNVFYSGEHTVAFPIDFACCSKIGYPSEDFTFHSPGYSHPLRKDASVHIDLYSLAALFIAMGTGGYCMANSKTLKVKDLTVFENIHDSVSRIAVPNGVKAKFEVIVANAAEASNTPYTSATQLVDDLELLLEIIDRRGMHPEALFDASEKEFNNQCDNESGIFHYELQDDLITEAVDFDSKAPVDILAQNTILLGGGGSGKTTKIRKLWEQCLSDWKTDRKNNPIPVYVPMNTFDSKKSNWDFFIRDYITTVYFPGLSMDVSQRRADLEGMFKSTGKYILFLDGINEAVDSSMLNAEIATLAAIENVTVIITSRNDLGDGWSETKKWFSTAELLSLDDGLIIKKLQQAQLNTPSTRLLRTLRRPMFLAMYIRLKIMDVNVETSDQILHAHHNYLIQSCEAGHHGAHWERFVRFALNEILPQIASGMDRLHFSVDDLQELLEADYSASAENAQLAQIKGYFEAQNQTTTAKIIELYRNCGIMRAITDTALTFTHQQYLDFYRALDFAQTFPKKQKSITEQYVVRPYNYLELKQYYSAEEIAFQLTQNDALLYPAESLKKHGGSPQQWAAHIRANPENWLFLWEEDTKRIVGNWSLVFLSPEQEAEVKEGRFAEEQFLVTTRYDVASDPTDGCAVYLLNISTNDGIEDNRLVLWQTFINRLLEIAGKGVFLRGVYANALNDDNEGVFRSKGFMPVAHNINGGKIFYLDLSSGFPKALSYFTSDIDLESLYYQTWSKHISFKQLAYDDVHRLSTQQQRQLARLVWLTDSYIYPAMFSQDQAELLLPRLFAENSDSMFSLDNIFCAMIGDTIVGMILFHKGPLCWSAANLKRWSKSLPPTIDIVEREYFTDYKKTPPNCISIINCCVDEKWRKRGIRIGSKMLEEFLKLHKTETIDLYVLEESTAAVTLYLRHGFKMVSACEGFSVERKDLPCYYMKRHLAEEVVPTIEQIVDQVSAYYCVEAADILGVKKGRAALARKVSFYLIRKLTMHSLPDIARKFNRDYSTVIYAIRKIQGEIETEDSEIKVAVKNIVSAINAQYY